MTGEPSKRIVLFEIMLKNEKIAAWEEHDLSGFLGESCGSQGFARTSC